MQQQSTECHCSGQLVQIGPLDICEGSLNNLHLDLIISIYASQRVENPPSDINQMIDLLQDITNLYASTALGKAILTSKCTSTLLLLKNDIRVTGNSDPCEQIQTLPSSATQHAASAPLAHDGSPSASKVRNLAV